MKISIVKIALVAFTLLLSANPSSAADNKAATPQPTTNKAGTSTTSGKPKKHAAARIKLIDINSAKKEELKTLPGITDADAAKIVANRPYGSKAWLASDSILTQEKYLTISKLVVAKQPYKDAAKNAALYRNKK